MFGIYLLNEIKDAISRLNISEQVELLGRLGQDELHEQMIHSTAFIHNSEYETFSIVCAEALSVGTPLIVNELPAVNEYFQESEEGLLVKDQSSASWAAAMKGVVEKFAKLKNNPNKRIKELFSASKVGSQYQQILNKVLHEERT